MVSQKSTCINIKLCYFFWLCSNSEITQAEDDVTIYRPESAQHSREFSILNKKYLLQQNTCFMHVAFVIG